jgi:hypothetical protein
VSGWAAPPSSAGPPGAPVAWAAPDETPGLGTSDLLRGAWHLYGSASRRLLTVAAIPELVRAILTVPSLILATLGFRAMSLVMSDTSQFFTNPRAFQAEFQAATRPSQELAAVAGLCGGLTLAVVAVSWAVLTAAGLEVAAGRSFTVEGMFRAVAARRTGIIAPAVVVAVVYAWLGLASGLLQPTSTGVMSASQVALYGAFALLLGGLTIAAFILAIYWSLALPAILAERLGLRAGLVRGARLTRGIRIRLGLALIAASLLAAVTVGAVAAAIAIVSGIAAASVDVGIAGYLLVTLVGAFLWAPFIPCLLTVAYRDRVAHEASTTPPPTTGPIDPATASVSSQVQGA